MEFLAKRYVAQTHGVNRIVAFVSDVISTSAKMLRVVLKEKQPCQWARIEWFVKCCRCADVVWTEGNFYHAVCCSGCQ